MRKRTRYFSTFSAAGILLVISCAGQSALAGKPRAVRTPPTAPAQWNHEWANGAVFYEVFVRSFSDSDGDGKGDLDGLIAKLDYLNDGNPATTTDLGIDAIWLMPVFQSPSYHGYDTVDYETINRDYGTNSDFKRLLEEAHKRGIRVIIDLVLNHTGSQHPWFVESASSPNSAKRDWFVWSDKNPGWKQPWGGDDSWHPLNGAFFYGVFWSGMPDLNYRTKAVREEAKRIADLWLLQGIDGYRLDATRYLVEDGPGPGQSDTPETHQFLKELSDEVRRIRPDAVLVAENTVDTRTLATYYGSTSVIRGGDEMPMNFNFPLASAILQSVNNGTSRGIRDTRREMIAAYPSGVIDAPFLTNHDQTRLATVLGNNAGKLRNAAAILLTLPGAPFLYYGEEVGLQNGPTPADESKRTPMPWTSSGGFSTATPWFPWAPGLAINNVASQTHDSQSLLSYYRNWTAARKHSPGLLKGDLAPLESDPRVLAFIRDSGDERVLVVHNLSDASVKAAALPVSATRFETLYADVGVTAPTSASGAWSIALPARSSGTWRIR